MKSLTKKVCIVGNFNVGKTSLVRRFVHQTFSTDYLSTIGVKIDKKVLQSGDTQVTLILWDIAGEIDMEDIPRNYLMGAHGIIFVFDLSRPATWENLGEDVALIRAATRDVPVLVVANKSDLLASSELESLRNLLGGEVGLFTSAKTGEGVEKLFENMADILTRL